MRKTRASRDQNFVSQNFERLYMDKNKIKRAVRMILEAIGENADREDLKKTPERVAEMYAEIFSGISKDPAKELEVLLSEKHHEIVLLKDISLYSVCEHHLLPFIGKAHIAYIPKNNRVTGLSKIARVVEILSKRLQVQERLTTEIAEHLCMSMRGVKKSGVLTVTSAVRGVFKENQKTRAEALALIKS